MVHGPWHEASSPLPPKPTILHPPDAASIVTSLALTFLSCLLPLMTLAHLDNPGQSP